MVIKLNHPVAPNLDNLSIYLDKVNESGWYTNFGPMHQLLTKRLEAYLDVENLLLVSNGTLGLQVAMKVFDIKHCVSTPFSFVATSSAALWQGVNVSYADIDQKTFNLSPYYAESKLNQDNSIDSIIATHVYGNPCDVNSFERIARAYDKKIIYDAAHCFGVNLHGKSILKFGDASVLSFHATKVFHTIEGGAIVFKRKSDLEKAKMLINFGIDNLGDISDVGINAKLNEYQCAVGLDQLDIIEGVISKRSELWALYRQNLSGVVQFPKWKVGASYNGAYMPICISNREMLEEVKKELTLNNIQYREYFSPPLHKLYGENKFTLPVSDSIENKVICLPLHYYLKKQDVQFVTEVIIKAMS